MLIPHPPVHAFPRRGHRGFTVIEALIALVLVMLVVHVVLRTVPVVERATHAAKQDRADRRALQSAVAEEWAGIVSEEPGEALEKERDRSGWETWRLENGMELQVWRGEPEDIRVREMEGPIPIGP